MKPALPIFGTVSASTALSPPITPSEVPVPIGKDALDIPPEPRPGISRVAEIMRFGFPGLDNIRSHRWRYHYPSKRLYHIAPFCNIIMLIYISPFSQLLDSSFTFTRDYILSYDRRNRTAHWVFEHLTRESVARNDNVDRAKSSFIEDQSIHPYFRSRNSDYKVIVYVCTFFINGNKYYSFFN